MNSVYGSTGVVGQLDRGEESWYHLEMLLPADRPVSEDPVLRGACACTVKRDIEDTVEQGRE